MQGSGSETVQTVSRLFGLNYLNVLADNQGMISDPNQPLAGRSILLCGQNGEALLCYQQPRQQADREEGTSSKQQQGVVLHGVCFAACEPTSSSDCTSVSATLTKQRHHASGGRAPADVFS
jgi:hypothetical protein